MIEEKKDKPIINQINAFLADYFKIIIFTVVVATLVIGYFFLIRPEYERLVVGAQFEKESANKEYSELQEYLKQLKELKAGYEKIKQSDIDRIEMMLPRENNHEHLLSQIETIILKNGLLLKSIEFSEGEVKKKSFSGGEIDAGEEKPANGLSKEINQLKLKVNIGGADYLGLKSVLSAFENNLRLMDILNLSFDPKEKTVSLDLAVYYLKD